MPPENDIFPACDEAVQHARRQPPQQVLRLLFRFRKCFFTGRRGGAELVRKFTAKQVRGMRTREQQRNEHHLGATLLKLHGGCHSCDVTNVAARAPAEPTAEAEQVFLRGEEKQVPAKAFKGRQKSFGLHGGLHFEPGCGDRADDF